MVLTTGVALQLPVNINLIPGLLLFGVIFAVNSSIHSYLVVSYADFDSVSVDVGFYYMANAAGRQIWGDKRDAIDSDTAPIINRPDSAPEH